MATTIGTVAPYKKGSPPDFGTLYSGRALSFDGVSDYVSCGTQNDVWSGSQILTLTGWFNINTHKNTNGLFGKARNDNNRVYVTCTTSKFFFGVSDGDTDVSYNANGYTTDLPSAGIWHHFVCVYDGTQTGNANRLKIYLNGELKSLTYTNTIPPTTSDDSTFKTKNVIIGNADGAQDKPFDGKLTNFQIWDKAWTLEDVQWAYTHPEGLITDNIPAITVNSPTISNLKAWYPMTEGSPTSPQTTVYDGSPKELGDSIITGNNSTFASGVGDWTAYTASDVDDVDGALKIVKDGTGTLDVRAKLEFSPTFDTYPVGTVWELSWDMWKDEGLTATTFEMSMAGGSGSAGASIMASSPVSTTRQSYSGYFTQINSGDIITNCHMVNGVGESEDIGYYIDNITLKEVKMGNHGATVFTEIIKEDDASIDNTSDWTVTGTSATKIHDTDHYDHGNDGANSYFYSTFSGVANAQYEVQFKIKNNTATADFDVNATYHNGTSYTEGSTSTIDSASASYTSVKHTFTANATSGSSRWGFRVQSDLGRKKVSVKDLSITQIGVASGWTTADAEPLIPQTALMGMSKPMIFDGVDDKIDIGSSGTNLGTADWSFSWWMKTDTSLADKRIFGSYLAGWSIQGEGTTKIRLNSTLSITSDALPASGTVNDDKLHHYVMTMDRDTDGSDGYSTKFYRDGSLWSTITGTDSHDLNQPLGFLGAYHTTGAFCKLDVFTEISQWNSVLSLAHVQELFNDGVALDATTHSARSNLVGYWKNNGTSTWTDLEGGKDGTVSGSPETILLPEGTTSGKDILGFPLTHPNEGWLNLKGNTYTTSSVNADGSLVSIADNDILDIESAITVEAWLRVDHIGNEMYAICKDTDQSYALKITNSGVFKGVVYTAGGRVDYSTTDTAVVGTWYHIAMTYDGANVKMYKDSVLKTTTAETTNIVKTTQPLRIGAYGSYATGGNYSWEGQIDEVRIYNRALSAKEISKNWKHGKGKHS